MKQDIQDIISKITKAFDANVFRDFILYIRFPKFKSIERNARIDFTFPFTVLTGVNGSGKSSVLHALYGAPADQSTSDFWFSTNIDPINNDGKEPNCFIYGYIKDSGLVEILKQRTGMAKGSDYWEPQAPLKKYNMIGGGSKKRVPPINKNVIYIDFRDQMSAFDKFFYFGSFKRTKTLKNKQDVIRKYSKFLKNRLDGSGKVACYGRSTKEVVELSGEDLNVVNQILGKSYKSCKLVFHNYYVNDGLTILFETADLTYTEAYAGRGEFAVVRLVYEISISEMNSLLLLDEPESSLHPRAQKYLKLFILKSCLSKQLQVVLSTHSPIFVEGLPSSAIKLFYNSPNFGFGIMDSCHYLEAFDSIGADLPPNETGVIIVEDIAAKLLIERVLDEMGKSYKLKFSVLYYAGGASDIFKSMVGYSQEDEYNKFVLLDGDKKSDLSSLPGLLNRNDLSFVEVSKAIEDLTDISFGKLGFRIDGGYNKGMDDQKLNAGISFLRFLSRQLDFLPQLTPESIIWDEEFANRSLSALGITKKDWTKDGKENILIFTQLALGNKSREMVEASIRLFVNSFVKQKNPNYMELERIIGRFSLELNKIS